MKKLYIAGTLILLILFALLIGYMERFSADDVIDRARKELDRTDATSVDLKIVSSFDQSGYRLIWFIAGDKKSGYSYVPMAFLIMDNGSLKFNHVHKPMDRAEDIAVLPWINMYSFLINNPNCKAMEITDAYGNVITIPVDTIPFVYWLDITPTQFSEFRYEFLDKNGEYLPQ